MTTDEAGERLHKLLAVVGDRATSAGERAAAAERITELLKEHPECAAHRPKPPGPPPMGLPDVRDAALEVRRMARQSGIRGLVDACNAAIDVIDTMRDARRPRKR